LALRAAAHVGSSRANVYGGGGDARGEAASFVPASAAAYRRLRCARVRAVVAAAAAAAENAAASKRAPAAIFSQSTEDSPPLTGEGCARGTPRAWASARRGRRRLLGATAPQGPPLAVARLRHFIAKAYRRQSVFELYF